MPSKLLQSLALDIEDLEVDATPEDLMLSYVSGEKDKVHHPYRIPEEAVLQLLFPIFSPTTDSKVTAICFAKICTYKSQANELCLDCRIAQTESW